MTVSHVLCSVDLDAARIPDWQERLRKGRWAGPDAFDREWAQVLAEYHAACGTDTPEAPASAAPSSPRNYVPNSRMLTYDEVYTQPDRLANTPSTGGHA